MKSRLSLLALSIVGIAALSACTSTLPTDTDESAAPVATDDQPAAAVVAAVEEDPEVAALLPTQYADAGVLQVGSNLQFPPANFYATDGTTPIGYEVDIATAIAARLGVDVNYNDSAFENLITSLQSKRVDFTMAGMNDRPDRQEMVDFIDYFKTGIGILVAKGNPDGIAEPSDLCGHSVTAGVGSSQEAWALKLSDECVADGSDPIDVVTVNNDQQRLNSVKTGRVTAELNDLANLVYIAQTANSGNDFEVVDLPPLEGALYGLGVNKETTDLRAALAASLESLVADGTYGEILDAWGLSAGAIDTVEINAGK
jgi:polar amino acid transport system substrate-binding protein